MSTAEKPRRHRAPAFVPVPTRARADGWTPEAQARFITALSKTRSVSAAAQSVGLSRASAYKLRQHPQAHSFAAAWDAACHDYGQIKPRKLTLPAQWSHALEPLIQPPPLTRPDAPIRWKIDNKPLLILLRRFTRAASITPLAMRNPPR